MDGTGSQIFGINSRHVLLSDMEHEEKKAAYNCDITYITNNELGFDYLRDNMVVYKEQLSSAWTYITVSSMKLTRFLLMRQEHLLLFPVQSGKSTKLY